MTTFFAPLRAALLLCLALTLAGCASGPIAGSPEAMRQASADAQAYRLSGGDKIHVAVFGEDNLSGDYTVGPDGQITLPLAGNVKAAGYTISELRQAIATTLEHGYVQNPNITISAIELKPYFILGAVTKPGRYSYAPDLTVLDAVATAEGFTYRANMGSVYIRHKSDPSEKEYDLTSTLPVQPGDTIRVAERYF